MNLFGGKAADNCEKSNCGNTLHNIFGSHPLLLLGNKHKGYRGKHKKNNRHGLCGAY